MPPTHGGGSLRTLRVMADEPPEPSPAPEGTPVGRRVFLGLVGLAGIGIVAGASVQGWLERSVGPILGRDPTGVLGLLPFGRFRFYTVTGDFPQRSRAAYRLRVDGLVDTPLDLTFADLQQMRPVHVTRDFQCVTGWRVTDVTWTGVRLRDIIDRASPQEGARALRFVSFDGAYTESLTMPQARRDDVIVAYSLEGEPLSSDHGGPARLYVAPMYGYKSIKWLERIELVDKVDPGFWEVRGYDVDGWVGRSNGRVDEPT
jgi:DMSO/TMAO reductase YedYZ molybdopterin-dependent catalytic subunit